MFSAAVVNLKLIPKPLLPPLWVNIRFLFIFKLNIIYGFVSLRYGLTRDTRCGGKYGSGLVKCWIAGWTLHLVTHRAGGQVGGVSHQSPVLLYCPVFIENNNHYSSARGNKINIITIHLN